MGGLGAAFVGVAGRAVVIVLVGTGLAVGYLTVTRVVGFGTIGALIVVGTMIAVGSMAEKVTILEGLAIGTVVGAMMAIGSMAEKLVIFEGSIAGAFVGETMTVGSTAEKVTILAGSTGGGRVDVGTMMSPGSRAGNSLIADESIGVGGLSVARTDMLPAKARAKDVKRIVNREYVMLDGRVKILASSLE